MRQVTVNAVARPALRRRLHRQLLSRSQALGHAGDVERLLASQPERGGVLARLELQRKHAHPHQVTAVDALEALGDDRPHAEELRPLGRPVARAPGAVLRAGQDEERRLLLWYFIAAS